MNNSKNNALISTLSPNEILGENGHKLTEIDNETVEMKYCTHCHQWHPLTEFYKNKQAKDGLHSWCKSCFKNRRNETRVAIIKSSNTESESYSETGEQTTARSLETILDEIREREQDRDNEISELKRENNMLKNNSLDLDKLTERDIDMYLKSHDISVRILFEAIARREGKYIFYAYDTETGLKIPIRIEQQAVA